MFLIDEDELFGYIHEKLVINHGVAITTDLLGYIFDYQTDFLIDKGVVKAEDLYGDEE